MTSNQIIKELLCRLAAFKIGLGMTEREYLALKSTPLSSELYTQRVQNMEDCVASPEFLGGEAKALWDMVNESPYTPLETELLQRLQMACNNVYDLGTGDGKLVYRACFAPTEDAWLDPLQVWFKDGPPWMTPGGAEEWAENKDQF